MELLLQLVQCYLFFYEIFHLFVFGKHPLGVKNLNIYIYKIALIINASPLSYITFVS